MGRRVVLLTVSLVVVAMLLLASCGPRASAPTPTTPIPGTPTPAVPTPATPAPGTPAPATPTATETPKYGGTVAALRPSIRESFDAGAEPVGMVDVVGVVYEQLLFPDWTKGVAGSGMVDWGIVGGRFEAYGPQLAESWEIPEIGTWVFQIRRGVHWALNPNSEASRLVGGRELTADDVVWNIIRFTTDPLSNSSTKRSQPGLAKAVQVEKTGPWEVTLKTPVDPWNAFHWVVYGGTAQHFFPPEVIKKYGSASDWRNAVGTGPFMIADFISGNAETFVKNPNYWGVDPIGPGKGNQLPYVDTIKLLIVPDTSTRMAAMRTDKADWITEVEWEDAQSLFNTKPTLQNKRYLPAGLGITMRIEKEDLPFKDKRVRQALMMATDFEAMKNDLFEGFAEINIMPVQSSFYWLYIPIEELPESARALYQYNPERAKQLLAEAGYPKGFKTKIVVENRSGATDAAAVFKAMWAKVGVDLEILPREFAVYSAISTARSWEEMYLAGTTFTYPSIFSFNTYRAATLGWKDDVAEATHRETEKYIFKDMPKVDEIYRKFTPYIQEQAYIIPRPTPYSYTIWQPWLKNYHGERAGTLTVDLWPQYVWVDQDLKEKMTGRR